MKLFPSGKQYNRTPMLFTCGMSRSGTTLLTTVLDSHSQIGLGYELIPPRLPAPNQIKVLLEKALLECGGDFERCGQVLRQAGHKDIGLLITRSLRTGLSLENFLEVLDDMEREGLRETVILRDRLVVACKIAEKKKNKESAALFGFKLNIPSVAEAHKLFPGGHYVFILRNPLDVVASHRKRGFNRTTEHICKAWNNYLDSFLAFQRRHPEVAVLIRYEDLVTRPHETIESIFRKLPVEMEDSVFTFYRSKATVHLTNHPNAEALRQNFFATSVGRWRQELDVKSIEEVETLCGKQMEAWKYECYRLSRKIVRDHTCQMNTKKQYAIADYENLLGPYLGKYEIMRYCDYVREFKIDDRKIVLIRHDVDHDHITALKMAKWEYDRNIRSTYCLLHTAWYYGELDRDHYVHTLDLVDCARALSELGHEINLHNNLVALALIMGLDPVETLKRELAFFRSLGIDIKGTSTHGDKLCRELNFRNWELFKECCDDRFGGPRTITWLGPNGKNEVHLGKISMFDFDLEYEGYDVARDVYHTDSGGNLRTRYRTPGRRPFGRLDSDKGEVVGILTHPVWWKFD